MAIDKKDVIERYKRIDSSLVRQKTLSGHEHLILNIDHQNSVNRPVAIAILVLAEVIQESLAPMAKMIQKELDREIT